MSKKLYIGVNGVAQEAEDIYVGVNGIAKKVIKGYVGVENEAKLFWDKQQQIINYSIPQPLKTTTYNYYDIKPSYNYTINNTYQLNFLNIIDFINLYLDLKIYYYYTTIMQQYDENFSMSTKTRIDTDYFFYLINQNRTEIMTRISNMLNDISSETPNCIIPDLQINITGSSYYRITLFFYFYYVTLNEIRVDQITNIGSATMNLSSEEKNSVKAKASFSIDLYQSKNESIPTNFTYRSTGFNTQRGSIHTGSLKNLEVCLNSNLGINYSGIKNRQNYLSIADFINSPKTYYSQYCNTDTLIQDSLDSLITYGGGSQNIYQPVSLTNKGYIGYVEIYNYISRFCNSIEVEIGDYDIPESNYYNTEDLIYPYPGAVDSITWNGNKWQFGGNGDYSQINILDFYQDVIIVDDGDYSFTLSTDYTYFKNSKIIIQHIIHQQDNKLLIYKNNKKIIDVDLFNQYIGIYHGYDYLLKNNFISFAINSKYIPIKTIKFYNV